jgi:hypothetical protein
MPLIVMAQCNARNAPFVTYSVLADVGYGCLIKPVHINRAVCSPLCANGTYESSPCSAEDGDRQCTGGLQKGLQEVGYITPSFTAKAGRRRFTFG